MPGFGFRAGRHRRRTLAVPAGPVLQPLALDAATVAEGAPAGTIVGVVTGRSAGATLTLADAAGDRFVLDGAGRVATSANSTDFEVADRHVIVLRETLAGAANGPRDSVIPITVTNVFEQPALQPLGLGTTRFAIGTAAAGSITGLTAGSLLAAGSLPAGLTVDAPSRTWAWSGAGSPGAATVSLAETLADSANSPRTSTIAVTVETAVAERIVGSHGRIPNAATSSAALGTRRAYHSRVPFHFGGDVTEFALAFDNWSLQNGFIANPGADTLERVAIEVEGNGIVVPVTFDGGRSVTLAPGARMRRSDLLSPQQLGFTGTIPRGTRCWVRLRGLLPAGADMMLNAAAKMPGGYSAYFDPAGGQSSNIDGTGTLPFWSGQTILALARAHTAVVGRFSAPGARSVIGVGDSILDGANDTLSAMTAAGFGYLQRSAVDANGANPLAMLNITRNGIATTQLLDQAGRAYWQPYLALATDVVDELGTNNLGTGPGNGAATALDAALRTLWALYREMGVARVIRTKLQPRAGSASGTSPASQTIAAGWDVGGQRDLANAAFAQALAQGAIDSLVDLNAVWEDAAASGRWVTNSTANFATADGTHPSAALHALAAPILRNALIAGTESG